MNLQDEQFTCSLILGVFMSVLLPKMNYDIAKILQNPLIKTSICVIFIMLISEKTLPFNIMFLLGIIMLFSTVEQKNIEKVLKK